jgi:hypothetical protein
MEEPGEQKDDRCGYYQADSLAPIPETKVNRIVKMLEHEVFPVDVYSPPQISETGCKEIAIMRFG